MTDAPENHTLKLLQAMRADMQTGFAKMNERFDKLEAHIAASDEENAKTLDQILQHTANINEVLVDMQARVVRHEKRIKALEKQRPEA